MFSCSWWERIQEFEIEICCFSILWEDVRAWLKVFVHIHSGRGRHIIAYKVTTCQWSPSGLKLKNKRHYAYSLFHLLHLSLSTFSFSLSLFISLSLVPFSAFHPDTSLCTNNLEPSANPHLTFHLHHIHIHTGTITVIKILYFICTARRCLNSFHTEEMQYIPCFSMSVWLW